MRPYFAITALGAALCCFSTLPLAAQQRAGWVSQIDGVAAYQASADLSDGGDFTADRAFLRATGLNTFDNGASVGISVSYGRLDYEFSQADNQPWSDIRDIRVSAPIRVPVTDTTRVFVSPQVRWDYQNGADSSEGQTYGVFAGVAWMVSDTLTIGPAFGAFTRLEDDSTDLFPALLVDWNIGERWNLNTGSGLGATRGPGLTLSYVLTDDVSLSLSARSEEIRFRLDEDGIAPNGIGEDQSIPVVAALRYSPNPAVSLNVFAGAEFDGQLSLADSSGTEVSRQNYDTAPLVGLAFRVRF